MWMHFGFTRVSGRNDFMAIPLQDQRPIQVLQACSRSGWVLTSAEAVNDRGYIVGSGTYNGVATAFVLIPLAYP